MNTIYTALHASLGNNWASGKLIPFTIREGNRIMSRNTINSTLVALACAASLSGLAMPTHARDGAVFLRGEVGNGDSDFDFSSTSDQDDSDRVHAARLGYYFNPYFAVEAFYGKLYDERVIEIPLVQFSLDAEVDAAGVGVVGKKRFGEARGFFVQGRGGAARYKGTTTAISNPCASALPCRFVTRTDDSTTGLYLGVGAGYDFSTNVGVGVNYDLYKADFDDIGVNTRVLTAAVEIRF